VSTAASPQLVVTSGTFSIDGEDFAVDNNIWVVGDDDECLVVDAAHEAGPIVDAVGGRRVVALVCTHGHNDHINAAVDVADAVGAPIALHKDDLMLWDHVHPDRAPDLLIDDGTRFVVGGTTLVALHTPGHSPGGVSLHDAEHHAVYGGDTLFKGGPGATGRSFSDFPTIIESIRTRLLDLPADTVVYTGHGATTTIGDEAPDLDAWIARGH
jgi:glyoxylase-like metal-dependent hydrolase (beta-lactamase superfamily II)